jgi:hypothetical protein
MARVPIRWPHAKETPEQIARRLTADQVASLLTGLQRASHRRGDTAEAKVLAGLLLWLNGRSALADAASRRLTMDGLAHVPAEAAELAR